MEGAGDSKGARAPSSLEAGLPLIGCLCRIANLQDFGVMILQIGPNYLFLEMKGKISNFGISKHKKFLMV